MRRDEGSKQALAELVGDKIKAPKRHQDQIEAPADLPES
jgi:hypothetical protein